MAEEPSTTRSGKEYQGTEDDYVEKGLSDEKFKGNIDEKSTEHELEKEHKDTTDSTMEMMMHFLAAQERKWTEEKERYERERREEKERYERERRIDIERYERERQQERDRYERERKDQELERRAERERYERDRREERAQWEKMEKLRREELQRLENAMKLKEVNITKLNPTDDIENYLTTFERTAKTFEWPDD